MGPKNSKPPPSIALRLASAAVRPVPPVPNSPDALRLATRLRAIGSGTPTQPASSDNNPVIRLFQAPSTPRYQRSDNNQLISIGYKLHQHADGTIMTEHSMGPNDNSVVVTEVLPQTRRTTVRSGTTPRGGTTSRSGGTGGGMGGGY